MEKIELEEYIEMMYMMQLFAGYYQKHQNLVMLTKRDGFNIKLKAEVERAMANLKTLEPVLAEKQNRAKDYLNEKYDMEMT